MSRTRPSMVAFAGTCTCTSSAIDNGSRKDLIMSFPLLTAMLRHIQLDVDFPRSEIAVPEQ
jgi:hypothetical protein